MADSLEFLLKLDAKVDGLVAAAGGLKKTEEHAKKAGHQMTLLEQVTHKATHHMGEWLRELGKEAASTFTGFLAAEAVWESLKKGVEVVEELGREMFKTAGDAQRTSKSFENMLGQSEGKETLEYLEQLSKHTEFGRAAIRDFGQQLLDAGFRGERFKLAMGAVIDVASRFGTGKEMEGAQNAIAALSRANLQGTLDARVLRGLKLEPQTVFHQMAEDLGMGEKELKKKLEAGKVATEDVVNSVYKALVAKSGKPLAGAGGEMAGTFNAQLGKFKEIPEALFERLADSKALEKMTGVLAKLVEMLDPDAPTGKKAIKFFEEMADAVAKLAEAMTRLVPLAEKMMSVVGGAASGAANIASSGAAAVVGRGSVDSTYQPAFRANPFGGVSAGLTKGMEAGAAQVKAAGDALGGAATKAVEEKLEIHSPSKVFERLGRHTAKGFERGLDMGAPDVRGAMDTTFAAPLSSGRGLGGGVTVAAGAMPIEINVSVDQPNASADEIAAAVRDQVPSAILYAIERLGLEGGAA